MTVYSIPIECRRLTSADGNNAATAATSSPACPKPSVDRVLESACHNQKGVLPVLVWAESIRVLALARRGEEAGRLFDTLVYNRKTQTVRRVNFFISIGRNPLKSDDSKK